MHGVLNTDNMSILGVTIGERCARTCYFVWAQRVDACMGVPLYRRLGGGRCKPPTYLQPTHTTHTDYGPFGFMDKFDPYFSPNLTDIQSGRRYCYRCALD